MTAQLQRFLALSQHERRALMAAAAVATGRTDPGPVRLPRTSWPARFRASPAQASHWYLWRLEPTNPVYHVAMAYDVTGPLDVAALTTAVCAVVARHESLRTTFDQEPDGVTQRVHASLRPDIATGEAASRLHALDLAVAAVNLPFDLRRGPCVRVRVWRYAPDRHLLLVVMHHIVVDERSSRLFERELSVFYRGVTERTPVELPHLPLQYADLAAWLVGRPWSDDLDYWRDRLAGAVPSRLPEDRPAEPARESDPVSGPEPGHDGATHEVVLGRADPAQLGLLAAVCGASRFAVAAAAFAVFLWRRTGSLDVVFGTPVSGRTDPRTDSVIGCFLNTVVICDRIDPGESFLNLTRRLAATIREALSHQDAPFHDVVGVHRHDAIAARVPMMDVMFVYLSAEETPFGASLGPAVSVEPVFVSPTGANTYVTVGLVETGVRLRVAVQYSRLTHHESTVDGYAVDYESVLVQASADPSAPVGRLLAG